MPSSSTLSRRARRGRTNTLRDVYERLHRPAILAEGVVKGTIHGYLAALGAIDRYGLARIEVRDIRQSDLLTLKAGMLADGLSPATFHNYFRHIKAILNTAVVEGLIEELPRTPRIKRPQTEQRGRPTPEQFNRLMAATEVARWPRCDIPAPVVWKALFGVAYLTALRRGDLIRKNAITWDALGPDGLRWFPAKTKRHRKWVFCPDVRGVLAALVDPLRGHGQRIFSMMPIVTEKLGATQRRIACWAEVDPELAVFHSLRRASLDAWCTALPEAAGLIAGHGLSLPRITKAHYVSPDAERARIEIVMREAASRFPLPTSLQALVTR